MDGEHVALQYQSTRFISGGKGGAFAPSWIWLAPLRIWLVLYKVDKSNYVPPLKFLHLAFAPLEQNPEINTDNHY